ncbi:MAG: transposase family protein [Tannerellaceae bacterium]|nr:transposase family protein [Tannerellaceae bacterium]
MFIAIASIICGAESWYDMEELGKAKEEWLKTFLRLPSGTPSHVRLTVFSLL